MSIDREVAEVDSSCEAGSSLRMRFSVMSYSAMKLICDVIITVLSMIVGTFSP